MTVSVANFNKNALKSSSHRIIGIWLFAMCAMVLLMITIGGLTRLTGSGLSMVVWRPITGWLPPITSAEWQAVFFLYQNSPEYKLVNIGMTLGAFKSIFWLEYIHRLWGRIIGLAFFLPLVYFWVKGWVRGALVSKLILIFSFGVAQGFMGWFMVVSGLTERPEVSQYRLTAHLGLAILIYAYMFWVALGQFYDQSQIKHLVNLRLRRLTFAVMVAIFLTMLGGGLVAGLDAGLAYNSFPLMDGKLIPEGLFQMSPFYINFFENILTVQFDHRLMAKVTVALSVVLWWQAQKEINTRAERLPFDLLAVLIFAQFGLGILTLVFVVPIPLATAHQAGAFLSLTACLWALNGLTYNRRPTR